MKKTHKEFVKEFHDKYPDSFIDIIGEYKTCRDEIECRCRIHDYKWNLRADKLMSGRGCKFCNYDNQKTNHATFLEKANNSCLNFEIIGKYVDKKTKVKVKCKKCGVEKYLSPQMILYHNPQCIQCNPQCEINIKNSVYTTHPHIAYFFANKDEAKKITHGSSKEVNMKCPFCGYKFKKCLNNASRFGINCPNCSDKISYPEKLMSEVLLSLNVKFIKQYSRKNNEWCKSYRYDFFLEEYNTIIEMHGEQHYVEGIFNGYDLNSIQENDRKKSLALSNHVLNYIIIDSKISEINYIKTNIYKSKLLKIFDLNLIDWEDISRKSLRSYTYDCVDLFNKGKSVKTITEKLQISIPTAIKWLREAKKSNLIIDNFKDDFIFNKKTFMKDRVVCLTTNEVFKTASEAGRHYQAKCVWECCHGTMEYSGFLENGTRLKWMYYSDYIKQQEQNQAV